MYTARALVLDDKPLEALPVIQALSMLGIPTIYSDGTLSDDFEPYTDIRIIFIDMVLAQLGADANDPIGCANIVSDTICRLINPGKSPVITIGWTGQESVKKDFEDEFVRIFPYLHDKNISTIDKPSLDTFEQSSEDSSLLDEKLSEIKDAITKRFEEFGVLSSLFYWEKIVHDSTVTTTNMIAESISYLDSNDELTSDEKAVLLLAKLAGEAGGSRLKDLSPKHTLAALMDALKPILIDALDRHHIRMNQNLESVSQQLKENMGGSIDNNTSAKINSRLHLSFSCDNPTPSPGYIYILKNDNDNQRAFNQIGLTNDKLIKLCTENTFQTYPKSGHIKDIEGVCVPFAMEISASCDYAQQKQELYRFILGCLFYEQYGDEYKPKKAGFLYPLGPFSLPRTGSEEDARSCLYFNARYIVGVPCHRMNKLKPFLRLRSEAYTDISHWQTNYNRRPGVTILRH